MQDSPRRRALSDFTIWLNRRFGNLLPEEVQELIACTWLFSAVFWSTIGQTLYYGIQPVLDLSTGDLAGRLYINWEALLSRLNEHPWSPNQFRLNQSESGTPTITLGEKPLLQPDPAVARTWLYQLQGALL